jgi:hypothetical protein
MIETEYPVAIVILFNPPLSNFVGQVDNLRPIGNRPVNNSGVDTRRITNRRSLLGRAGAVHNR